MDEKTKTKKRNPDLAVSDDVVAEQNEQASEANLDSLERKEFEELVNSLAPYALDGETPSQTQERLLADRKEFETELLARKKELQTIYDETPRPGESKISFVQALTGISEKKAEAIFSNFTGTHKQYEEQLANKTITWQTPIAIVAHTLDLLMKEPG